MTPKPTLKPKPGTVVTFDWLVRLPDKPKTQPTKGQSK
jgi:hypothetical protein